MGPSPTGNKFARDCLPLGPQDIWIQKILTVSLGLLGYCTLAWEIRKDWFLPSIEELPDPLLGIGGLWDGSALSWVGESQSVGQMSLETVVS